MLSESRLPTKVSEDGARLDLSVMSQIADSDGQEALPGAAASEPTRRLRMARASDAALTECVTLRALLDIAPGLIALVEGEDHVFQFANCAWLKVVEGDMIGRAFREVLPQAEAQGLLLLMDSIRAGRP